MKQIIFAATIFATLLGSEAAIAQRASHGAMPGKVHRQRHQIHRIKGGVRSGELTHGEARQLAGQQARIDANKHAARADGVVTPGEKRSLERQQNAADRNIYRKKHNGKYR